MTSERMQSDSLHKEDQIIIYSANKQRHLAAEVDQYRAELARVKTDARRKLQMSSLEQNAGIAETQAQPAEVRVQTLCAELR